MSDKEIKSPETRSMTGFGRGSAEGHGVSYEVELRAVNSRFLDVQLKCPRSLYALESKVRTAIGSICERGRVDVFVSRAVVDASHGSIKVNEALVDEYVKVYRTQAARHGVGDTSYIQQTLLAVLGSRGVLETIEAPTTEEEAVFFEALKKASRGLLAMRTEEGGSIARVFADYMESFSVCVTSIVREVEGNASAHFKKVQERVATLLAETSVDQERMLTEIAILADKLDVSEELERLESHIQQFNATYISRNCGRKLEFILQEMGRECNTLGVKVQNASIQALVVEAKGILEKLREQALNVE